MKMQRDDIEAAMFAPCGMNCKVCYRHCNHKSPCTGCLSGDGGKPAHCRNCAIRDCARGRGLAHCYACAGYPCKRMLRLEKSYTTRYGVSLLGNGRFVKENGLAAFLAQQKRRYTCPKCGGVISLHDARCSACGAAGDPAMRRV